LTRETEGHSRTLFCRAVPTLVSRFATFPSPQGAALWAVAVAVAAVAVAVLAGREQRPYVKGDWPPPRNTVA
jgi:hypothetical protein